MAQERIERILGTLRKQGRLAWNAVLDLTRDLAQWQTYGSPRKARAAMRRRYTEDRWLGQPAYPVLIVEKDTLEPVCKPMAYAWQMPFASSRGYSSLTLQHDVAEMLRDRHARTGQEPSFISSATSTLPGSTCNGHGRTRYSTSARRLCALSASVSTLCKP
jgi:hypothetical protein